MSAGTIEEFAHIGHEPFGVLVLHSVVRVRIKNELSIRQVLFEGERVHGIVDDVVISIHDQDRLFDPGWSQEDMPTFPCSTISRRGIEPRACFLKPHVQRVLVQTEMVNGLESSDYANRLSILDLDNV